jgi:hypothetical protein
MEDRKLCSRLEYDQMTDNVYIVHLEDVQVAALEAYAVTQGARTKADA